MKQNHWVKKVSLALLAAMMMWLNVAPVLAEETTKLTIVSVGSDAQVWRYIAELDEVKAAHIELTVKEIDGGVELNNAVADGVADANAFQSLGYMNSFNREASQKLVPIGTTYIEPMGLYSKKYTKLSDLPQQATVVLPESPVNAARALLLLQSAGLVKLKADFDDATGTPDDVTENPKQLQFKLVEDTMTARSLEDVDAAIIGNTIALEGGLNVLKDALYKEEINEATKSRINVIAVKKGRESDPVLLKLVDFYHLKQVQDYVKQEFQGTKVEVKQPVKEVWSEAQ